MASTGAKWLRRVVLSVAGVAVASAPLGAFPSEPDLAQRGIWPSLVAQSRALGLPTQFLQRIPPEFVRFEFEDLRTFAAEYHPADRRMVLNRALSFNAAAGSLKPLKALPPRDLSTLFHEFTHVYLDYVSSVPDGFSAGDAAGRLLNFAREQQACRYQVVAITPILQRKSQIETRILSERESWEALHETWAVFVGWVIWTQRELKLSSSADALPEAWLQRVKKADREGEWSGYYEPEDSTEREIARKRYLGHPSRLTLPEAAALLQWLLEYSEARTRRVVSMMEQTRPSLAGNPPCQSANETRPLKEVSP